MWYWLTQLLLKHQPSQLQKVAHQAVARLYLPVHAQCSNGVREWL